MVPPLVVAHKGASRDAPEHTIHAFDLAVLQGANCLECDLQLTKDGVLVCIHDETVDRTSNGSGEVRSLTLRELRRLDWGSWFNRAYPTRSCGDYERARIVTLEEYLDRYLACHRDLGLHIELKEPSRYGGDMERTLVEHLEARNLIPSVPSSDVRPTISILSFELSCLKTIKRLSPALPTIYVFIDGMGRANSRRLPPHYVGGVAPSGGNLTTTPDLVAWAHHHGLPVHAWTVNEPTEMETLVRLGVATITTDRPGLLREVIAREVAAPGELVSVA